MKLNLEILDNCYLSSPSFKKGKVVFHFAVKQINPKAVLPSSSVLCTGWEVCYFPSSSLTDFDFRL